MIECIVCDQPDCKIPHSQEEIRAVSPKFCYVCRAPAINMLCEKPHTIDEIINPPKPTAEEFQIALRILIAYSKLCECDQDNYV